MRSMSAIRARVAELEALVDEREVWDDRRLRGQNHSGPVVIARRPEVVSLHPPACIGAKPVHRLASRRLYGRDPDPSAGQRLREGDPQRPRQEPPDEAVTTCRSGGSGPANAPWGCSRRASRSTPLARAATPATARSSAAWC